MVMDDLTLKGVMDPSSIWTVICMLVNGFRVFGLLFSEGGVSGIFSRCWYSRCTSGPRDGFEPTGEVK